jgi:hypothetical protein
VLRVANSSGFYGDRFDAPQEMLEGGPIDVLTGDYLAELTMLILWRGRAADPTKGYATTFLAQMEECLGLALDRGVKIVTNAGGLNPAGLAERLRELADELGLSPSIAHITGDDLLDRLDKLQADGNDLAHLDTGRPLSEAGAEPLAANAYLGSWGITEALSLGADVVVCPRVTDAAVVVGPAAWRFGWGRRDWDRLAGAVVAGHVLECGAQATGGNYAFFDEVPGLTHPGFPIAEIDEDGTSVITKHEGTGGRVSVGTVTAQLLYEIDSPRYVTPDVVARFDTIRLDDVGEDRVRISGVEGEPPPGSLKVGITYLGGFRNEMVFVLTGLDVDAKADLVTRTLEEQLDLGSFDEVDVRLLGRGQEDPPTNDDAIAYLRIVVKDGDAARVGKALTRIGVELALASYPGFTMTRPPEGGSPFGVYWPTLVDKSAVEETVTVDGGPPHLVEQTDASDTPTAAGMPSEEEVPEPDPPVGPTRRVPLGRVVGARSGDKGGNANVGLWTRSDPAFAWLERYMTVERFVELVPEAEGLEVRRYRLPNLRALNFVVVGLLGEGVSASARPDPQAKGLGEFLRARHADIPVALLDDR